MNHLSQDASSLYSPDATLKDSFMVADKKSLVNMSKILGWNIKSSLKKEAFAIQLTQMVLENPSHVLDFLTVYELRILKEILESTDEKGFKAPLMMSQLSFSDMYLVKMLVPQSMDYALYSVTADLKSAFLPWIDKILQKKLDRGEELLDTVTMGFLNLYGNVDKDPLVQMIASCQGVTSDRFEIENYLLHRSCYSIHQILFNEDDGTVTQAFSSLFLDAENIDQLLQDLEDRPGITTFKPYSEEEVKAWGQMPFPLRGQPQSKKVYDLLKTGKIAPMAADTRIHELWVESQFSTIRSGQLLSTFLEGLDAMNIAKLNKDLAVITDFTNQLPRWFLKGYTPVEITREYSKPVSPFMPDVSSAFLDDMPGPTDNPWAGQKIRPNDPCPCGSGKKYKKCHGRNIN